MQMYRSVQSPKDRLTVSPGIPIKQEPISEASSPHEEPGSFDLDFNLFDPESVPEFLVGFDHNNLPVYAQVPGGYPDQEATRFPL